MRNLFIVVFLYNFFLVNSQINYFSKEKDIWLWLNLETNSFEIGRKEDSFLDMCTIRIFSEGTVIKYDKSIILFDKQLKRYYKFDKIKNNNIIATKHTALFKKGILMTIVNNQLANDLDSTANINILNIK